MRITGGELKGRIIHEPHSRTTHPMAEKIRTAIFNVLGDVEGLPFLDAFAGSGAISLEAVSRGASQVLAIEKDKSAHEVIQRNIDDLELANVMHAVRANAAGWSNNNEDKQFDIVILAPPYDNLQEKLVAHLAQQHTKTNGLAVLDWPGKKQPLALDGFKELVSKTYGDAQLVFYRKRS